MISRRSNYGHRMSKLCPAEPFLPYFWEKGLLIGI